MPLYTPFFNTLDLMAYSRTGIAVRRAKARNFGLCDLGSGGGWPKVGIAFCTLCSRMDFDAMHYAMHIIAAFCGILRRYLDISRSIMVVGV